MMAFIKEFKTFVTKGNIIDLSVAVIIGGAFGKIISSLVENVITPLLLNPALKAADAQDIANLHWGNVKYGNFLSAVISFLIIAFVLFLLIKGINAAKKLEKKETDTPELPVSEDTLLLREIRDLLKKDLS
jgi:large conductance mechanosensitive channel